MKQESHKSPTVMNTVWHAHNIDKKKRAYQKHQKPCIFWLTGLSGSGKSTIAGIVEEALFNRGNHTYLLDGDNIRLGLNKDLGFNNKDREENIRRIGEVANLFCDAGLIVFCAFISPFEKDRDLVRSLAGEGNFVEVFIDSPLSLCEERDPKGLYTKARNGEIPFFTGIDSPYETPSNPEIILDSSIQTAEGCAQELLRFMENHSIIKSIN